MTRSPNDEPTNDQSTPDQQDGALESTGPGTVDYSLPEDNDPANQDDQANADEIHAAQDDQDDLPVSGDVTGGNHAPGSDALAGAGVVLDDGIDPNLRTEMLDNAVAYADDTPPSNVNDEPGFDDGVPNSFSDFSVVSADTPGGVTRLADPSFDAGGEVHGARISGSGGFDGGPPRTTPLPGTEEDS
ncbi:hypothetical protein [Deinococcus navajonensis]|uniref:DUF5709 domain-containing protein n=1 Tax=Deinococcus navajonensis TaxID=309884 RepID=A0ABV8XNT2_9DEIO